MLLNYVYSEYGPTFKSSNNVADLYNFYYNLSIGDIQGII